MCLANISKFRQFGVKREPDGMNFVFLASICIQVCVYADFMSKFEVYKHNTPSMRNRVSRITIFLIFLMILPESVLAAKRRASAKPKVKAPIESFFFAPNIQTRKSEYKFKQCVYGNNRLTITLEDDFSNLTFREDMVQAVYDSMRAQLPEKYRKYDLRIISRNHPIEDYVPNRYRLAMRQDKSRVPTYSQSGNVVHRTSWAIHPSLGLLNRNIALWNSHGLYYNYDSDRWEWQRPRMFGTVEDLLSSATVLQFLMPMLRNAGAEVYMPRERDVQTAEIALASHRSGDSIIYSGEVYRSGEYWVRFWSGHINKNAAVRNVKCIVRHGGVETTYEVDPTIGGDSWTYLDQLYFSDSAEVVFVSGNKEEFCVDSVKLGGGISHRNNGYPRFAEAALYNLMESGAPDSILFFQKPKLTKPSDYYDDLFSRSKWVNFLMGGSDRYPSYPGLGIPIDASIAIHTDASFAGPDSVVGTLLICSTDTTLASGCSQMVSHELADLAMQEIDRDMKSQVFWNWAMRGIWHQSYVESRIPMVPSLIIEMLSHQNFNDMKYGLSPRFRFLYARAVYKSILKYLAAQYGTSYVVQPLPIQEFHATVGNDSVRLAWRPTPDSLEPSAYPQHYIVYTRVGRRSFDNGVLVNGTSFALPVIRDSLVSYKVTAVNEGGESFSSEILTVCQLTESKGNVMIANCFDRVGGPSRFNYGDQMAGFDYLKDFGVPYMYDIAFTGRQYEFNTASKYVTNDYPGFGASAANYEQSVIAGNNFDYPYIHAMALAANGYSSVSSTRMAVTNNEVYLNDYDIVDIIMGNQRTIDEFKQFPIELKEAIINYTKGKGKKIILTGAYVGSEAESFAGKVLHFKLRTPYASVGGEVATMDGQQTFLVCTNPNSTQYFVQNCDGIAPADKNGRVLLRYSENRIPAMIGYDGKFKAVVAGFPFEALRTESQREDLMRIIIEY